MIDYAFRVRHQEAQELVKKALEAYQPPDETPEQTAAINDMIGDLDFRLSLRSQKRKLRIKKEG